MPAPVNADVSRATTEERYAYLAETLALTLKLGLSAYLVRPALSGETGALIVSMFQVAWFFMWLPARLMFVLLADVRWQRRVSAASALTLLLMTCLSVIDALIPVLLIFIPFPGFRLVADMVCIGVGIAWYASSKARLSRRGRCQICGYDRVGLSPVTACPECGNQEDGAAFQGH
ncbi:MAG TPA: hypothetical protein VFF65_10460 [Phycisphaerales bacterium]|nr:hypothetical protein [Phycisphaerales bacterium]